MGRPLVAKTGNDLRRVRVEGYGGTLRDVSAAAGVAPSTVLRWENQLELPRCPTLALRRIMRALRVRLSEVRVPRGFEGPYERDAHFCTLSTPCGAKTRSGHACKKHPVDGKTRCRLHGGMSTGPRTEAGRARCARAARDRHKNRPMS